MINVLIVEDQQLFREGVKALISTEDDIEVVGIACHGHDAIRQIVELQPDVVLMDIHMPEVGGIEATRYIKEHYPNVKVILLTTHAEEDSVVTGLSAGADGFLVKSTDTIRLIRSIRDVYENQVVLAGEAARILAKKLETFRYDEKEILGKKLKDRNINLSIRELDIAILLMNGTTNKEMARKLHLSEGTIKNYISEIYNKLGLHSRKEVIRYLDGILTKESYG